MRERKVRKYDTGLGASTHEREKREQMTGNYSTPESRWAGGDCGGERHA